MKKLFLLILPTAALAMSGCNDFLDTMPDNRAQIDSPEKVQTLLVSAYPNKTFATILDARCDGFKDFGSTLSGTSTASFDFTYTAFRWDEYPISDSGNDTHEKYWLACYDAIAAANHALKAIDEMGGGQQFALSRAEALVCRAYAHFCLLSIYSNMFEKGKEATNPGIPYVTEPETVIIKQYDRETVARTIEHIWADLNEGMAGIGSRTDYSQPKFHFTRESALALAVRISLFTRDYNAVISYADQLLTSVTKHDVLGITNPDGSPAKIPSPTDNAMLQVKASLFDWVGASQLYSSPDELGSAFSSPDQNCNLLVAETVSILNRSYCGSLYTRYALSAEASGSILQTNATGLNWVYPSYQWNGDESYWCPKTYEDFRIINATSGTGVAYVKIALLRLEEVLLARAEAYALTGQYEKATDDLNMYVQRRLENYTQISAAITQAKLMTYYNSAINSSTSYINSLYNSGNFSQPYTASAGKVERALVMTILDFRRAEFAHEGMRWFDILRWNIPVTHKLVSGQTSTLYPNDDRRVIQVPQTASLSGVQPNKMDNIPAPWN